MNSVTRMLQLLSVACLGVYAGSMLTEGLVLVPWWRSMPPAEFFAWYAANDQRLLSYFSPVTSATALVTLAWAAASLWTRDPARRGAVAAAALMIVMVAMFFAYFESANASFSSASLSPQELPGELARWQSLHAVRMLLSVVALASALATLRRA